MRGFLRSLWHHKRHSFKPLALTWFNGVATISGSAELNVASQLKSSLSPSPRSVERTINSSLRTLCWRHNLHWVPELRELGSHFAVRTLTSGLRRPEVEQLNRILISLYGKDALRELQKRRSTAYFLVRQGLSHHQFNCLVKYLHSVGYVGGLNSVTIRVSKAERTFLVGLVGRQERLLNTVFPGKTRRSSPEDFVDSTALAAGYNEEQHFRVPSSLLSDLRESKTRTARRLLKRIRAEPLVSEFSLKRPPVRH